MSRTNYIDPDEGWNHILHDMYGLTPAQVEVWAQLHNLVEQALIQFEQGYAVDVEAEMAELARKFAPTAKVTPG
jgi:hypothetical protein